jgi:hypothetical protein
MKIRCYDRNEPNYPNYGGRGIKVCDEWFNKENGFINFYNWAIENEYRGDLSIDRIDVNGNYEPSNCRWATRKVQGNNKRNNRVIEINGEEKTITEWADEYKLNPSTFIHRIKLGISGDLLLSPAGSVPKIPSHTRKIVQLTLDGKFIREYNSSMEAERVNEGVRANCITRACQGKIRHHKGYRWIYKENYNAKNENDEN